MIIVCRYELTDLGMNHSGVMKIIEDWTKHVYAKIPYLWNSEEKFVIMMHPGLKNKINYVGGFDLSMVSLNNPIAVPDADGTFPGAVEENCTIMNLKIVVTTALAENELVITSEEFIHLVEGFIKRGAEDAYQKGARDTMRMDPQFNLYDENYMFVNLGDEKSVKKFMKRVERKWTK